MRRNIYSALGVQWFSAALGIVSSIVIARMMQPAELGVFTVTMAVTTVVGTLQMAGTSEFLLYTKTVDTAVRRSVYGMTLILTAIICAALVLGRPLLTDLYGNRGVADVAAIAALQMAIWVLVAPVNAMLNRVERFDLLSLTALAQNVTLSVGQVAFTWAGFSYMGLAYAALLGAIVSALVHIAVGRQYLLLWPSFRGLRPIIGFGGKLFAANALSVVNTNAPAMLIGSLAGLAQGAMYGRANMIAQIYNQTISRAIDPLLAARIAAEMRDGAGPTQSLVASSRILLTLSVAFFGFVALSAHLVVPLIFGSQWSEAAPAMRALAIGLAAWPLAAPTAAVVLAASRPGVLIRLRAINAITRITAVVVLARWGLEAVAWGIAATTYFNLAQSLLAANTVAGVRVHDYLVRLSSSLLTGLVPLGITGAAMAALVVAGVSGWSLLLTASTVMAVAQLGALIAFRHPLWLEVMILWRRRRSPALARGD